MSRRSGSNMPPLGSVEKIELSEKHIGWRIAFFILFLVIAATAFATCTNSFLTTEPGWQEIEADSSAEANCGSEFVFLYYLGGSGRDATAENKALKIVYSDACELAHKLFHNKELFTGVNNVRYINEHPNEVIEVEPALYEAFSVINEYQNRNIYLAPVYARYDEIFTCEEDAQLVNFDPKMNAEVAAEYAEIAAYANNPEMVDVKLLGDNRIQLMVAEEYQQYAKENYITDFIDFFWMKNAFILDYLAEELISRGYTMGSISSYDGFTRSLDDRENTYSFNIYNRVEQTIYQVAVMQYSGRQSMVYFRDYVMSEPDWQHYYVLSDGTTRTAYVDSADGIAKTALNSYYAYGKNKSCAEVLLQAIPVYVTDAFSESAVENLQKNGIYSIYCEENRLKYNEETLVLTDMEK